MLSQPDNFSCIKSYVLRTGHFTDAQQRSYNLYANEFIVPFANDILDFRNIFGNNNPVIAEIGFGMGKATAAIAEEQREYNYLGIEVHKPGIGRLLWEINQRTLLNVRIIEYDAVKVFSAMIPASSLEGVHIFFPDPWPKKRHHKRRLVQRPFTNAIAEKLKQGGYLLAVTDWDDYADCMLSELCATDGLINVYDGFAPPQTWRPNTGFEEKGLGKKHIIREILFRRK